MRKIDRKTLLYLILIFITLGEKCPNTELFHVRIWTLFTQCQFGLNRSISTFILDGGLQRRIYNPIEHQRLSLFRKYLTAFQYFRTKLHPRCPTGSEYASGIYRPSENESYMMHIA